MESQNKNKPIFHPNSGLKLMDQVREVLRYHHYAYRTEQTYCKWILLHIYHFGGKTHPNRLGAKDVEQFLSHLATEDQVSASTQRQALNALVFSIGMSLASLWSLKLHLSAVNASKGRPPCSLRQ